MARYFGKVGYGTTVESPVGSGVWVDGITERSYFGDVVRANYKPEQEEKVNDNVSVQNSISIVADQYLEDNFMHIRYVEWAGHLWKPSGVQLERPRLIISLGDIYNGPTGGD